jgi:hypothetical protein
MLTLQGHVRLVDFGEKAMGRPSLKLTFVFCRVSYLCRIYSCLVFCSVVSSVVSCLVVSWLGLAWLGLFVLSWLGWLSR